MDKVGPAPRLRLRRLFHDIPFSGWHPSPPRAPLFCRAQLMELHGRRFFDIARRASPELLRRLQLLRARQPRLVRSPSASSRNTWSASTSGSAGSWRRRTTAARTTTPTPTPWCAQPECWPRRFARDRGRAGLPHLNKRELSMAYCFSCFSTQGPDLSFRGEVEGEGAAAGGPPLRLGGIREPHAPGVVGIFLQESAFLEFL